MTKQEIKDLIFYGSSIILSNLILRLSLGFLPGELAYIIKTLILFAIYYLAIHKRLGLTLSAQTHINWIEKLKVGWLVLLGDFFFLCGGWYGSSMAPKMIPLALIIALGAGFLEEYLYRGLLIQVGLRGGIRSTQQVWGTVLLSSLFFGLAHLGNALYQPLDATFFQVYYAMIFGIFFSAIYLRTGSLWWTIILHCLIDFSSITVSQGTQAQAATSIWSFISLLPIALYSFFLLRPKKIAEMTSKNL